MTRASYNPSDATYRTEGGLEARGSDGLRSLCRKLVAAGHTGSLVVVDAHTARERLHVRDVEKTAKTRLTENDTGFRVVKWRPNPFAQETEA